MDEKLAELLRRLYGLVNYDNLRTAGEVASMTPTLVGDVASGMLALDDLRKGDYLSAAGNAVGVLPFIPAFGGIVGGKLYRAQKPDVPNQVSETLLSMTPGRGSGHFGTGTYYVGNKENLGSLGKSSDRVVVESTVPTGMFQPKNEDAAFALHDGLRALNDAVYDSKLTDKTISRIKSYFSQAGVPFDLQKLRDSLAEAKNISGRSRSWQSQSELGAGKDSASTAYMKALGYKGVDTSDIQKLDTTRYGTVIYKD